MLSGHGMGQSFIDTSILSLSQFVIQVLINKPLSLSRCLFLHATALVRRYSEINRSVEGGGGDDRREREREKFRDSREAPACCSETETATRKRRKREREKAGRMELAICVSISWRARERACPSGLSSRAWAREMGPTCRPSRGPFAPPPPTADAAPSGGAAPRRGNRRGSSFQASALLRHSRVMLLDPDDPRG